MIWSPVLVGLRDARTFSTSFLAGRLLGSSIVSNSVEGLWNACFLIRDSALKVRFDQFRPPSRFLTQLLDEVPEKQGAALQVFLVVTRELKGDRISRVQVEDCDGIPRTRRVEVAAAIDDPNKARLFENVHLAMDRL